MVELGIVGLGSWGRRLVLSVQGKSDRVHFKSAVVGRPDRAKEFAETHRISIESDYATMLRDPGIHGVVSCGPADLHAAHAIAALEAGKPVLSIKPIGSSAGEGAALLSAAKASGLLLALGYNRCFMPNVQEMRRRLKSGSLGRLLHAEGNFCTNRYGAIPAENWKADPAKVPAGSLADHMLYLVIETLGPIAEVHTLSAHDVSINPLADAAAVLLRTQGNASALLTAIGVTPDYYRFQIFGTQGWIELRGACQLTFQPLDGAPEVVTLPPNDPERTQLEAFADAVTGKSVFPVPVEDATHSAAVLAAMGRSAIERSAILV